MRNKIEQICSNICDLKVNLNYTMKKSEETKQYH